MYITFVFLYIERSSLKNFNLKKQDQENESEREDDVNFEKSLKKVQNKRRKNSLVWKFFKRSADGKFAKCTTCGKECKTSGNTSNLADHIKRFHKAQNTQEDLVEASTSTSSESALTQTNMNSISTFLKRSVKYVNNSERKRDLDVTLALLIATDFQPFNIVNDKGFRMFVNKLDPKYVIPSKYTLRENIMQKLYSDIAKKLKEMLDKINYVALTTDMCTSKNNESYLTVTCHFINSSCQLKTVVLATTLLCEDHTGENIKQALECLD